MKVSPSMAPCCLFLFFKRLIGKFEQSEITCSDLGPWIASMDKSSLSTIVTSNPFKCDESHLRSSSLVAQLTTNR